MYMLKEFSGFEHVSRVYGFGQIYTDALAMTSPYVDYFLPIFSPAYMHAKTLRSR